MSDRSGGFLSSVGRFFSSGSAKNKSESTKPPSSPSSSSSASSSRSPVAGSAFLRDIIKIDGQYDKKTELSPSKLGNSLRYLSPSALDSNSGKNKNTTLNRLDIDIDPVSDIFSSPSLLNRKRQLNDTEKSSLTQTFNSDGVKRSKYLNRSLMENNLKSTIGVPKLDTTWCGEFSANHSPASSVTNLSLISRRSGPSSNGSNLSSRTQQIFRKLEQTRTPAKEIQRMTMIRAGLNRPERWGSSNTSISSDAPPLRKVGESIPSRIQLLSKTMNFASSRKPYWRDLTRKRSEQKSCTKEIDSSSTVSKTSNGTMSSELSSLFTESSEKDVQKKNENLIKKHQWTVKGSDGKAMARNTFKLSEDDDIQALPDNWINNAKITLDTNKAPPRGFLGNLSFSFAAPADAVSKVLPVSCEPSNDDDHEINDQDEKDTTSEKNSKESESESSSDEESSEIDGSESDDEKESNDAQKPDTSRAPTSTDTVSPATSLVSSKDNSPKNEASSTVSTEPIKAAASLNWTCDGCFTSWPESNSECGCCGQKKGGVSKADDKGSQKTLVSNLASFAPAKSTVVSFGFGSSSLPPAPTSTKTEDQKSIPTGSLFGVTKTTIPEPKTLISKSSDAPAATSSSDPARVAWDCPDCMVSNKATDDKCVCCGHVKYKSNDSSSSDNVFGNRAFKPSSVTGGPLFGIGSTSTAPSFGFGIAKENQTSAKKPSENSVDLNVADSTKVEAPKDNVPLFGSLVSKPTPSFGVTSEAKAPVFGGVGSLFGTSKPAEPVKSSEAEKPAEVEKPNLFASVLNPVTEKKEVTPLSTFPTFVTSSANAPQICAPATAPAHVPVSATAPAHVPATAPAPVPATAPAPVPATATAPAPVLATVPGFGSTTVETLKPNSSLFGNFASSSSSAPSSTTSTAPLFGTLPSLGSQQQSLLGSFGKDTGTTTTDGKGPIKKRLLSSPADSTTSAPKLEFGASSSNQSPFTFGSSTLAPSVSSTGLFGSSTSTSTLPAPVVSAPETKAPFVFGSFGSTSANAPTFGVPAPAFGSNPPVFGSTNTGSFGGFGASNSTPALNPTISNSSSTNSLFNQPSTNPFQMNSSVVSNGFNFGSSTSNSLGGNGVFVFGSSAPAPAVPTASSGGPFQFGSASSGSGMENAFAYQPSNQSGTGARKMAMARRRNLRK